MIFHSPVRRQKCIFGTRIQKFTFL